MFICRRRLLFISGLVLMAGMTQGALAKAPATKPANSLVCAQSAIGMREKSLDLGWSAFDSLMNRAYSARAVSLTNAYGLTDTKQRAGAVKVAWDSFRKAKKNAMNGWNSTRKSAWGAFTAAAKKCNATMEVKGEDASADQ